jgi:hypothetical protein
LAGFFIYLLEVLEVINSLIAELVDPLKLTFVGTNEAVIKTFPRILGNQLHVTVEVAAFPTQLGILRPFSLNVTFPGLSTVAVTEIGLLYSAEDVFPAIANVVEVTAADRKVIVT